MMTSVGCTVTTVKTKLKCNLVFGEKVNEDKKTETYWKLMNGRDIFGKKGTWFYDWRGSTIDNMRLRGLILCPRKPGKWGADKYTVADIIVEFDDIHDRQFFEKIRCGDTPEGGGRIIRTREKIRWKFWLGCV